MTVDKKHQGQGIEKMLLVDAFKRSYGISKEIRSFAVVVDPLDHNTVNLL